MVSNGSNFNIPLDDLGIIGGSGDNMTIHEKLDEIINILTPESSVEPVIYDVINLGNERNINITDIVGIENIDKYNINDFICEMIFTPHTSYANLDYYTVTKMTLKEELIKSYNPDTGILSITGAVYNIYTTQSGADWNKVENSDHLSTVITYLKLKTPPI